MQQKLFKDLSKGSSFFLHPNQTQQYCFKLGADKYSCYGIVYSLDPEAIVYLEPSTKNLS
jgi:hypothetical protein